MEHAALVLVLWTGKVGNGKAQEEPKKRPHYNDGQAIKRELAKHFRLGATFTKQQAIEWCRHMGRDDSSVQPAVSRFKLAGWIELVGKPRQGHPNKTYRWIKKPEPDLNLVQFSKPRSLTR